MMRALVASSLGLAAGIFGFAAGAGLAGSWFAATVIAVFVAGLVGVFAYRRPSVVLDEAACSRGLKIVSSLATLVALVQLARLAVFMVDPSQVGYSAVPTSKWEVQHSCLSAYFIAAQAASSLPNVYDNSLYSMPDDDPLPLEVFCVEHGRWTSGGGAFGSAKAIAHPSIREEAQVGKSQSGIWESVARSAARLEVASPTGSYVDVLNSPEAKSQFDETARSIEGEYERELRKQLQGGGAVGVVVAINGRLVWADVFPSADLFQKYWPKLLRSYVLEAQAGERLTPGVPSWQEAQAFLSEHAGRFTIREEPGAYRRTEISGDSYQIVALEAIGKAEDTGLLVHYNKMARD